MSIRLSAVLTATPKAYLVATLGMHCRSFGDVNVAQFRSWIENTEWEPFEHPAIQAPAKGYSAKRDGHMTIVPLADLAPTDLLQFDPDSAKSRATGVVMANVTKPTKGMAVNYVVALVGPGDDGEDVLWTIHAGPPIRPEGLPTAEWAGRTVSVAEARALGVQYARC